MRRHFISALRRSFILLLAMTLPAMARDPVFPLRIADDHRHLVDAAGAPFLVTGDAAWSLIADLSREDADAYLEDRRQRGFNTLLVSLIESRFSRRAPRNFYGEAPFLPGKTFLEPNEAYFDHAEWLLRRARNKGFLVLLVPAYLGVNGGAEGWYQTMKAAGAAALRSYGDYVGRRFAGAGNILWVNGGDYNPPDKGLVEAIADGIANADAGAIQTVHASHDTNARDFWMDASWLTLDSLYTYGDVAKRAAGMYATLPSRPFFLIESRYEGEGAGAPDIRRIAYGALLSGASGQIFGNNPIWHFGGPGLYASAMSWQDALASPGAESITHLKTLFDSLPWWTLEPGIGDMAGAQTATAGSVAASAHDGSLVVVYLSTATAIVLRSSPLAEMRARWYDPSSGEYVTAFGTAEPPDALRFHVPAAVNRSGASDWVLVISRAGR